MADTSPQSGAPEAETDRNAAQELPLGVRVAAAWSWRLIAIGLACAALLWLIAQVRIIVIPVLIAILLTALLEPIVRWFERRGMPRWMGVVAALLTLIASVTLLVWLIVSQFRNGFDDVAAKAETSLQGALAWLESGPFGISADKIQGYLDQGLKAIQDHQSEIWSGALGIATGAGHFITGSLLTLFSLIFLLFDGKRIWFWVLGFLPKSAHAPVDTAGRAGWVSVGQYARVQILVALVNAIGIGVGSALLGVPLAVPIGILVFLGSFIPFLGAITTGAVAVFVSLVYNGPINALILLIVVILVHQLESHVLQPLIMGNAVQVHPLGVVLAVATGALLAGIPGALFAVPIAAAANSVVNVLAHRRWESGRDPVDDFHTLEKRTRLVKQRAKHAARLGRRNGAA